MWAVKNARLCARCRGSKRESKVFRLRAAAQPREGPVSTCWHESVPGARTEVLMGPVGHWGRGRPLPRAGEACAEQGIPGPNLEVQGDVCHVDRRAHKGQPRWRG